MQVTNLAPVSRKDFWILMGAYVAAIVVVALVESNARSFMPDLIVRMLPWIAFFILVVACIRRARDVALQARVGFAVLLPVVAVVSMMYLKIAPWLFILYVVALGAWPSARPASGAVPPGAAAS